MRAYMTNEYKQNLIGNTFILIQKFIPMDIILLDLLVSG